MSANKGINWERGRQEIKETVAPTQKRHQENSHKDGKWKPAGDSYTAGVEFKQFSGMQRSKRLFPTRMKKREWIH